MGLDENLLDDEDEIFDTEGPACKGFMIQQNFHGGGAGSAMTNDGVF